MTWFTTTYSTHYRTYRFENEHKSGFCPAHPNYTPSCAFLFIMLEPGNQQRLELPPFACYIGMCTRHRFCRRHVHRKAYAASLARPGATKASRMRREADMARARDLPLLRLEMAADPGLRHWGLALDTHVSDRAVWLEHLEATSRRALMACMQIGTPAPASWIGGAAAMELAERAIAIRELYRLWERSKPFSKLPLEVVDVIADWLRQPSSLERHMEVIQQRLPYLDD